MNINLVFALRSLPLLASFSLLLSPADAQPVKSSPPIGQQISVEKRILHQPIKYGSQELTAADIKKIPNEFIALSTGERDWLNRNGFVDRRTMARLQSLSTADLKKLAQEKRDSSAQTALGIQALRKKEYYVAVVHFSIAFNQGSIYALEWLATAEYLNATATYPKTVQNRLNARTNHIARLQQARDLGDHRAAAKLRKFVGNEALPASQSAIDEYQRALEIAADRSRAMERKPPLKRDERPNRAAWERIDTSQNEKFTVDIR